MNSPHYYRMPCSEFPRTTAIRGYEGRSTEVQLRDYRLGTIRASRFAIASNAFSRASKSIRAKRCKRGDSSTKVKNQARRYLTRLRAILSDFSFLKL